MMNLILSIRPEAFFSFLLVVGVLALNIFLLVKFVQMAKDTRESKTTLTQILNQLRKIEEKCR